MSHRDERIKLKHAKKNVSLTIVFDFMFSIIEKFQIFVVQMAEFEKDQENSCESFEEKV